MDYVDFGRTGLRVSVAGLGSGGQSKLGQGTGSTEEESIAVVQAAIDFGINLIDTAAGYGTEPIVGKSIKGRRDRIVLSTKAAIIKDYAGTMMVSGEEYAQAIDKSLSRLDTDYIDIFSVHAVRPGQLDYVQGEIVPVLLKGREAGKIRFLGITEQFMGDPGHRMMQNAFQDELWDAAMVGFNFLNHSARTRVFPLTQDKNVGVMGMFAVRRALSNPDGLKDALAKAAASGQIDPSLVQEAEPLGFLTEYADSITEGAYRYCRHEAGVDVVLTGTGKIAHLEQNVESINKPPLPPEAVDRLNALFSRVDCVSGD